MNKRMGFVVGLLIGSIAMMSFVFAAEKTATELKAYFEAGKRPTQSNFVDLIDSMYLTNDDNWPAILPASDASNLTNIPIPDPLPAVDGGALTGIVLDEWLDFPTACSYATATSIVLNGDQTSLLANYLRLRVTTDIGANYTEVVSRVYSSGSNTTTVNLLDSLSGSTVTNCERSAFSIWPGNALSQNMIGRINGNDEDITGQWDFFSPIRIGWSGQPAGSVIPSLVIWDAGYSSTTSPVTALQIADPTFTDGFWLGIDDNGVAYVENKENTALKFTVNNSNKATIEPNGYVVHYMDNVGTEITPNAGLVLYSYTGGTADLQLTNTTYGTTNTDGLILQMTSGSAELVNYENSDLIFSTNALQEMYLDASNRGLVVGSPTGAGKGVGTINAVAVYDDNVLLTDYVFDLYLDGKVNPADVKQAQSLISQPSRFDIDAFSSMWRQNRHLPSMPSRDEFNEKRLSIGSLAQRLWETVELQAIHIAQLNDRLKTLEAGR